MSLQLNKECVFIALPVCNVYNYWASFAKALDARFFSIHSHRKRRSARSGCCATKDMKVILLTEVKGLGKADDVVEVNDGYARNLLFKKNLALEATPANMNSIKLKKGSQAEKARRELIEAKENGKKLAEHRITLNMKAGEGGRLYGAVTAMDIAAALEKQGFKIDKKHIIIKNPIKAVGSFDVTLKLHAEVSVSITIDVKAIS